MHILSYKHLATRSLAINCFDSVYYTNKNVVSNNNNNKKKKKKKRRRKEEEEDLHSAYHILLFNTLIHCPHMVKKLSMYVGPHDVYPTMDVNFSTLT